MNPVLEALLDVVKTDPLPAAHTSSYWQQYGRQTLVERHGDQLTLQASGFEALRPPNLRSSVASVVQRFSYRSVTTQLESFQEVWRIATRMAKDLRGNSGFYVFRCAAVLSVLVDHWRAHRLAPKMFALIGDGSGFLGALIRRMNPMARLYCVDLPKMLLFQAHLHQAADQRVTLSLLRGGAAASPANITFVLPQDVECVPDAIDCAVNVASMQEMNASSIAAYFTFLRRRSIERSRFYCVNRLRKELPGGEVACFLDYPWHEADEVFLNGNCPYYTHFLAPYTLPCGPRRFGMRVPFVNYFDGVMMHRLVRLAPFG